MPGNWDTYQHLNNGRVEWPTGPLTDVDFGAERPTWLQAWVVQGGPPQDGTTIYQGPSQNTTQSSWFGWVPGRWTAAEPGWVSGNLQPGAAVGIALLALYNTNTGTYEYEWWHDAIVLYN